MNLQEHIRKVLRETLESEWNTGNEHGNKYDYQHGFCHYFAYNIINKIKKRYPKKKVNYYLLLANEVDIEDGTIVQDYLIHVYIQIDNILLDSNGITTKEDAWQMAQEWEQRQSHLVPENYKTEIWDEESNEIPEYFFNNQFCNTKRVKEDMKKFLSHPTIEKLLNDTIGESKESIRKVLREETEIPLFLRRRFTKEDLDWIVNDVKELIESGESIDTAVYDGIREFIKSKKFIDIDEFGNDQDYWESYLRYEKPLVKYVKSVLGIDDGEINLQEHIRKVLREETEMPIYIRRRYACFEDFINKLENGEIDMPIIRGSRLDWNNYQIILTAYMRNHCEDGNHFYDAEIHEKILNFYEDKLYQWFLKNIPE